MFTSGYFSFIFEFIFPALPLRMYRLSYKALCCHQIACTTMNTEKISIFQKQISNYMPLHLVNKRTIIDYFVKLKINKNYFDNI